MNIVARNQNAWRLVLIHPELQTETNWKSRRLVMIRSNVSNLPFKFLLLFWHELCISDSKIIEGSIQFLEQVNLQHTMGNAVRNSEMFNSNNNNCRSSG